MTFPQYWFPSSPIKAQSAALAPWATGIAAPVWTRRYAWTFTGSSFADVALPSGASDLPVPQVQSRTGHGYRGAAADGTGGLWLMADYDFLAYLPAADTALGYVVPVASGNALTGLVVTGVAASGNTAICVNSIGQVHMSAFPMETLATLSPGFNALARGATADATNLYSALPLSGSLGVMSLAARAFSTVSTPMGIPGIVSASSIGVAVAGWSHAAMAVGMTAMAASPQSPSALAVLASSSEVALLSGTDPNWSLETPITGFSSVASIAWNPDGSQVLATDSSGAYVMDILSGVLQSPTQTFSLSGAGQIAVTPDGTNALACLSSSNQIAVLINALDTWSVGTATSLTAPVGVVLTGDQAGWAISGSNLVPLSRSGNVWTAGMPIALGFAAKAVFSDAGGIYVTGGAGVDGALSWFVDGVLAGSQTWSSAGYGIAIQVLQGQVAVLLSDGQTILTFGAIDGLLLAQQTISGVVPSGSAALGATQQSLWAGSSSATWQLQWSRPFSIARRRVGEMAVYGGSSWLSASLGIDHDPSAIAWDASGNVWLTTAENDLWSFAGSATGTALPVLSYEQVADYAGQVPGTPMGFSSLAWWNGGLYASTAFAGAVARLK